MWEEAGVYACSIIAAVCWNGGIQTFDGNLFQQSVKYWGMAFGKSNKKTQSSLSKTAKPIEKLPVAGAKARATRSSTPSPDTEAAESASASVLRKPAVAVTAGDDAATVAAAAARPRTIAAAAGAGSALEGPVHSRPTREQIAELAYRYFAERGFQHGHADQDWARAEAALNR